MALSKQEKLDRFAQSKGYRSYFAYRNAKAREAGYSGYSAQRRARKIENVTPLPSKTAILNARTNLVEFVGKNKEGKKSTYRDSVVLEMTQNIRTAYREAGRKTTEAALEAANAKRYVGKSKGHGVSPEDIKTHVRPALLTIRDMDSKVQEYYKNTFPQIYKTAALKVDSRWQPDSEDKTFILNMQKQEIKRMLESNRQAGINAAKTITDLRTSKDDQGKRVRRAKRRPVKSAPYRDGQRHGYEEYSQMALRSAAAIAYNQATIRTARKKGIKYFEVYDGPGCGWSSHKDPEIANGKVVTGEEAEGHWIAHPNCVRQFIPQSDKKEGDLLKDRLKKRAVKAVKEAAVATAADNAISLVQHVAGSEAVQAAAYRVYTNLQGQREQFKQRMEVSARLYEAAYRQRAIELSNIVDITTGQPVPIPKKIKWSDLAHDVNSWAEDFVAGRPIETFPDYVIDALGIRIERPTRQVVGDKFSKYSDFMANMSPRPRPLRPIERLAPPEMRQLPSVTYRLAIERVASRAFFNWLGPISTQGKFAKLTFPIISGKNQTFLARPKRLSFTLGDLAKVTVTSIKDRGLINHLSLNPNGLIRMGLTRDPGTKRIVPTFRLIPKGPIHIMTRVNRGKRGNITSLSGEVRLITKQVPLLDAVSARFNLNLRKLGLESLSDIKGLRLDDFKRLVETTDDGKKFFKMVSMAADLRLRGFTAFDISKTLRLPWEDVEKLYKLTSLYLGDQLATLKALNARNKLVVVFNPLDDYLDRAANGEHIREGFEVPADHPLADIYRDVDTWTSWEHGVFITNLRGQLAEGKLSTQIADTFAELLYRAVPYKGEIFRGHVFELEDAVKSSGKWITDGFQEFDLTSWSEQLVVAEKFGDTEDEFHIVFQILPGAKSFPLHTLIPRQATYAYEAERITAGKFKVIKIVPDISSDPRIAELMKAYRFILAENRIISSDPGAIVIDELLGLPISDMEKSQFILEVLRREDALIAASPRVVLEHIPQLPKPRPRPPGTMRPILRVVDPQHGDPFAGADLRSKVISDAIQNSIKGTKVRDVTDVDPKDPMARIYRAVDSFLLNLTHERVISAELTKNKIKTVDAKTIDHLMQYEIPNDNDRLLFGWAIYENIDVDTAIEYIKRTGNLGVRSFAENKSKFDQLFTHELYTRGAASRPRDIQAAVFKISPGYKSVPVSNIEDPGLPEAVTGLRRHIMGGRFTVDSVGIEEVTVKYGVKIQVRVVTLTQRAGYQEAKKYPLPKLTPEEILKAKKLPSEDEFFSKVRKGMNVHPGPIYDDKGNILSESPTNHPLTKYFRFAEDWVGYQGVGLEYFLEDSTQRILEKLFDKSSTKMKTYTVLDPDMHATKVIPKKIGDIFEVKGMSADIEGIGPSHIQKAALTFDRIAVNYTTPEAAKRHYPSISVLKFPDDTETIDLTKFLPEGIDPWEKFKNRGSAIVRGKFRVQELKSFKGINDVTIDLYTLEKVSDSVPITNLGLQRVEEAIQPLLGDAKLTLAYQGKSESDINNILESMERWLKSLYVDFDLDEHGIVTLGFYRYTQKINIPELIYELSTEMEHKLPNREIYLKIVEAIDELENETDPDYDSIYLRTKQMLEGER